MDLALSTSDNGTKWLSQFEPGDQPLAARLIDEIMLVSRDGVVSPKFAAPPARG